MIKNGFAVVVMLLSLGFGMLPAYSQDSTPKAPIGQIAFPARMGMSVQIFVINTDGTGLLQLTNAPVTNYRPVWSPDGEQIAYVNISADNIQGQLMVMKADGSDSRPLVTDQAQGADTFAWSPDAKQVAFSTLVGAGNQDVFVADVASGKSRNLTADDPALDVAPEWSPDGKTILYQFQGKQNGMVLVDGVSGEKQVLDLPGNVTCSGWTQDSQHLLCYNPHGIFVVDVDDPTQQTFISSTAASAAFSPDEQKIVYLTAKIQTESETKVTSAIGVMDADGTHEQTLITDIDGFASLSWSSDNQQIAYTTENSTGLFDLYLVKADGSDNHVLVNDVIEDKPPAWRP